MLIKMDWFYSSFIHMGMKILEINVSRSNFLATVTADHRTLLWAAKGALTSYVDRILTFFWPPNSPRLTVFLNKTYSVMLTLYDLQFVNDPKRIIHFWTLSQCSTVNRRAHWGYINWVLPKAFLTYIFEFDQRTLSFGKKKIIEKWLKRDFLNVLLRAQSLGMEVLFLPWRSEVMSKLALGPLRLLCQNLKQVNNSVWKKLTSLNSYIF